MNETVVVTSTINVPTFLETLLDNAALHSVGGFSVLVIGDVKSPQETGPYCQSLCDESGVEITYLGIEDQQKAFRDYQPLWDIIPLNNNVRKMIGTLLAYWQGCERVILIDDDNYATGHDFIGFHNITGTELDMDLIQSESGWYNICESMIEKNRVPFYPRGYPWSQRFVDPSPVTKSRELARIVVNGGLVLEHPDIDAVSRLFWPIEVVAIDSRFEPHFGLHPGTWAPFNDQNTALCRELIPVYYKPPAGLRNADIWSSYIVAKLAEHMGDVIAFGQPLVRQVRNHHDLRQDYRLEEIHNRATDPFVSLLRGITLTEGSYLTGLGELLGKSLEQIASHCPVCGPVGDTSSEEQRHQQLPSTAERIKAEQEEMGMIEAFLLEYRTWYRAVSEVV